LAVAASLVPSCPASSPIMSLVATILSGNSADIVADAVHSVVGHVDQVLLIDTGITDATREIVRGIAGDKYRIALFPWKHDFAAARNFSLAAAERAGAKWALTLDTDERLSFPGILTRAALAEQLESKPEIQTWLVPASTLDYAKERFIRIPAT